jgi:hypothetical protein
MHIDEFRKQYREEGTDGAFQYKFSLPTNSTGLLEGQKIKLPAVLESELKSAYAVEKAKTKNPGIYKGDMKTALETLGLKYPQDTFDKLFSEADKSKDGYLQKEEFFALFEKIIAGQEPLPWEKAAEMKDDKGREKKEEDDDDDDDEMPEDFRDLPPEKQQAAIMSLSLRSMSIGTLLVLIFSDPMVDVLGQIGKKTGVPAFYVSFVLAPLASNASELVSSYKLACKKTRNSITQSLQTLEGAACMNNSFCLAIFLFMIFSQGLAWKFTAETISIFLIQFFVFLVVKKGRKMPLLYGVIVFFFYPLALVIVYGLENFAGLD